MKKLGSTFAALLSAALLFVWLPGCSDDDNGTNNNNNTGSTKIYMELKAASQYKYNRTELDSVNNPITSTKHDYWIDVKGNGNLLLGAYKDWFYRIGTDKATNEKDTLFIRTNTGSSGGNSFTKEVQVYGFLSEALQAFVDLFAAQFPIQPPTVPGPKWDPIAKFMDDQGAILPIGTEWYISNVNGEALNFNLSGVPVTVNVIIKGKFEAKDEVIMVGTKSVKTWKTTVTITATLPFGSPVVLKIGMWFSDDPDAQVKVRQESAVITIPFMGTLPIPGDLQEMYSYFE